MILKYSPEGQEPQEFQFKPGKLRVIEMEALQKKTGMPYGTQFKAKLLQGDAVARRALLWLMLRRQHPTYRWEDVDFADDELVLERDRDEVVEEIAEVEQFAGIPDEDREVALAVLRHQLETAPEPLGKAPSPTGDGSTGPT